MRPNLACSAVATAMFLAPLAAQNQGATFSNAVDGYIEMHYSPDLVPQSGITFEAWITYDDATLPTGWRWPTIMRQGNSGGGSENMFLRVSAANNNSKVLTWKVVTATNSVNVNWPFTAGQLTTWTHVAATYDGATARLFVNGVQVGSAAGNGAPIRDVNHDTFRIGKGDDVATPIEVWNGSIDEVRLWPFARTQAEIQATMNQQLFGVPGRVSTWNLDGHSFDTSGGQMGSEAGSVTFNNNPLVLGTPVMPTASGIGTPGCLGDLRLTTTSAPQVGNAGFGFACTRTAPNTLGIWVGSAGTLPSPVTIFGFDLWLDLIGMVTENGGANGLGTMHLALPLPPTFPAGFQFAAQAVVLDACGPEQLASSDALTVVVLP